jgi:D-alanine-D-alanine ligase
MRVAFAHNLMRSHSVDEAEFDTPEAVDLVAASLRRLGHTVVPIDVTPGLGHAIERLRAARPDLVFNTVEGFRSPMREAELPAALESLGIPYTGSGPVALATSLDKQRTKAIALAAGVQTPQARLVHSIADLTDLEFALPVIVKPNFEGSSMGITQASVVNEAERLSIVVQEALAVFPEGVLVEAFIDGRDLSVPYLEAAAPARGGILHAVEYEFGRRSGPYLIYDYEQKNDLSEWVSVHSPARLTESSAELIWAAAAAVVAALGFRDFARLDFRQASDGRLYFLEANGLPSLEPGAGIYASAAIEGLDADGVLATIIDSAVRRRTLQPVEQRALLGL